RSDDPVHVSHLVLASRSPFSGFVLSEDAEILRNAFLPRVGGQRKGAVYISRSLTFRTPANEASLELALKRLGLSIVSAERLPFAEQVELLKDARVVVAPHGAGLANLVWATASHVQEIFAAGHFNDCYARLAVSSGGTYSAFYCSGTPEPWGSAPIDEITTMLDAVL
ncbi:MAG TPA: glycosyltransferase family 61 protein, partial [Gaiellaceae bacterium]|nr:glycosyltransferase family 61 protein [Gaiellaceae bacterium]